MTGYGPAAASSADILIYHDQEAAGVEAGDSHTSGAFRTVTLNTEVEDDGGHGALASNQITLAAGTYDIEAWVSGRSDTTAHTETGIRFRDVTNSVTLVKGTTGHHNVARTHPNLVVIGRFTLAAAAACELQVYPVGTATTYDQRTGTPNTGEVNIAALVRLAKVS